MPRALAASSTARPLFVVVATVINSLVHRELIDLPYMVSVPTMGIVIVAAVELSRDLVSASRMASDLAESRQRNELAAHAAPLHLRGKAPDIIAEGREEATFVSSRPAGPRCVGWRSRGACRLVGTRH